MVKKILIALAVIVLLIGGAMAYLNHRNRTLSPPDEQRITIESGMTVRISYSRPSVRERLIFGTMEEGALQPYGQYWRLGANEATVLEFNRSVVINGQRIDAGVYGAYAIPGPDSFQIGINKTWDRWGFSEPDYSQDLVNFAVPVEHHDFVEQFTIQLGETADGVRIICEWDEIRFVIPVEEAR
jgi:hypothetical protein